jgi:hypothetical protein
MGEDDGQQNQKNKNFFVTIFQYREGLYVGLPASGIIDIGHEKPTGKLMAMIQQQSA